MATTKHLDPTNVDISIPAMTDQPNASVFSNCVDKEADAINALSDQITNVQKPTLTYASGVSYVSGGVYKYNRLVVIALRLTVPSTQDGATIATGLPNPSDDGTYSSVYVRSKANNGEVAVTTNGYLVGYDIPAGTLIMNLCYIAKP